MEIQKQSKGKRVVKFVLLGVAVLSMGAIMAACGSSSDGGDSSKEDLSVKAVLEKARDKYASVKNYHSDLKLDMDMSVEKADDKSKDKGSSTSLSIPLKIDSKIDSSKEEAHMFMDVDVTAFGMNQKMNIEAYTDLKSGDTWERSSDTDNEWVYNDTGSTKMISNDTLISSDIDDKSLEKLTMTEKDGDYVITGEVPKSFMDDVLNSVSKTTNTSGGDSEVVPEDMKIKGGEITYVVSKDFEMKNINLKGVTLEATTENAMLGGKVKTSMKMDMDMSMSDYDQLDKSTYEIPKKVRAITKTESEVKDKNLTPGGQEYDDSVEVKRIDGE